MKTITILSKVCINLSIGLSLQQYYYGIKHKDWIDFSTWSTTTLGFELLFLLSIVFSSIVRANRVALTPMLNEKKTCTQ